jgi:hypothetical protein
MVLETAQLLCTTMHHHGYEVAYKPTHHNHPCSVWARASLNNLWWLFRHGKALSVEYDRRYNRMHASGEVIVSMSNAIEALCRNAQQPLGFANVARNARLGIDHTNAPVIDAYRSYLNEKWRLDGDLARWTNRKRPFWFIS